MITATVIKSTGSWYLLSYGEEQQIAARIQGKFRLNGLSLTNPVAVGDKVAFEYEKSGDEPTGIIRKILPRQNYVVRQSPRKKHQLHLLASNIDQALLMVTMVNPQLKQGFIDRFLLMTEPHDIPVHILFNKSDLYAETDLEYYEYLMAVYENIGYKVHLMSSLDSDNLAWARRLLQDKITLVSGQSGVGKSTFVNAMVPGLNVKTDILSRYSGKGQHTTTFAEMHDLDSSSKIIDTPGIKTLSFNNLEPMDVAHNFREFFALSKNCKFADCSHREEPKCAVKIGLEEGYVSELRYQNYLQILSEIEDQNYWERHRHM